MTKDEVPSCQTYCPDAEINFRLKNRLVHPLERFPGFPSKTSVEPKGRGRGRQLAPVINPGACRIRGDRENSSGDDKLILVKEYNRSAAGIDRPLGSDLRTPDALWETVTHLLERVVSRTDSDWATVYEFIFDRLRAVRKDAVIQQLRNPSLSRILEASVVFYIVAELRSCERACNHFDSHLNRSQLRDCLSDLLNLYDCLGVYNQRRAAFEATNIIVQLGSPKVLQRFWSLDDFIRLSKDVQIAYKLSLACQVGNFLQAFRLFRNLSKLPVLAFCLHARDLRRRSLRLYDKGLRSRNSTFPVESWKSLFLYRSDEEVIADVLEAGLLVQEGDIHLSGVSNNQIAKTGRSCLPSNVTLNLATAFSFALNKNA